MKPPITYTIETLHNYSCPVCNQWWSIGNLTLDEATCPFCGYSSHIQERLPNFIAQRQEHPAVDYQGETLELSAPVESMHWYEAEGKEWPNGWRLPSRIELVTLFDEAAKAGHKFKDREDVWTTTSYSIAPTQAWSVDFTNGACYAYTKTIICAVRLVREMRDDY